MTKLSLAALCAAAALAATSLSHASTIGFTDTISGGDSIVWDTFGTAPAAGVTQSYGATTQVGTGSGNLILTPTTGTAPDLMAIGPSQIYTGGSSTVWSIALTAGTAINSLTLQVKEITNSQTSGNISSYFSSPVILGLNPVEVDTLLAQNDGVDPYNVITYVWEDLGIAAGQSFSISFSGGQSGHRVVDGFRVDTDGIMAVPEPSSGMLLGLGLGAFFLISRRRLAVRA